MVRPDLPLCQAYFEVQPMKRALKVHGEDKNPIVIDTDRVKPENVRPDWMAQIEALCETMDREEVGMQEPVGVGRTMLDDWRDLLMLRAIEGKAPCAHWYREGSAEERELREREAEYGTRDWRKAYPWMVAGLEENFRKRRAHWENNGRDGLDD